jgi:hypothetical protein
MEIPPTITIAPSPAISTPPAPRSRRAGVLARRRRDPADPPRHRALPETRQLDLHHERWGNARSPFTARCAEARAILHRHRRRTPEQD